MSGTDKPCMQIAASKDGGPAYPGFQFTEGHGPHKRGGDGWENYAPGMTLRDYFALGALQGQMSASKLTEHGRVHAADAERWANSAYVFADAMLKVRVK